MMSSVAFFDKGPIGFDGAKKRSGQPVDEQATIKRLNLKVPRRVFLTS